MLSLQFLWSAGYTLLCLFPPQTMVERTYLGDTLTLIAHQDVI